MFDSLGVTFGIMTAYGSHCERDEPAFMNSCVVAISNSIFSFIAGLAVFATLGHLAFLEGHDSVSDLEVKDHLIGNMLSFILLDCGLNLSSIGALLHSTHRLV